MVQRIAADHGGTHFAWAAKPENSRKLWQARHDAYYAYRSVFTPSMAHADVKKPGKMQSCTHLFDDLAASNSATSLDQSGFPSTASMSFQWIYNATPLM